ncbi:MAG: metal-dependent transcriptional regulator [Chloroflexia bacterium]
MAETLTPTVEDYLGLIYLLEREGQVVIGARLAKRLGVSRPTVTTTLQRMARAGLVRLNERKEVSLTPAGLEAAESLLRRHMLAEWLLRDLVGLPWHQVHEEADRLEHHFSERAVERLERIFPREACPHGNPMPGTAASEAVPLLEANEGEEVIIVRVVEEAEEKGELMAFLEENGLIPGTHLRVSSLRPYNETVTVEVAGRPVVLGLAVARFIQVRRA